MQKNIIYLQDLINKTISDSKELDYWFSLPGRVEIM